MYHKRNLLASILYLVVLIVESIRSFSTLPRGRRHVDRTSLNLCVDCFFLLVVVPAALIVSPAESSLRQVGGFLKIKEVVVVVSLLPRTAVHNEWCLGGTSGIRAMPELSRVCG